MSETNASMAVDFSPPSYQSDASSSSSNLSNATSISPFAPATNISPSSSGSSITDIALITDALSKLSINSDSASTNNVSFFPSNVSVSINNVSTTTNNISPSTIHVPTSSSNVSVSAKFPVRKFPDRKFTGVEHDDAKVFEGIIFPKSLTTDSPYVLELNKRLHHSQLMLIQARYEARIIGDQQMLHNGVWHGEAVSITEERLERVREYSGMGADIVAAWEDPETFFANLTKLDLRPVKQVVSEAWDLDSDSDVIM